jgi:hypothetical protein
VRSGMADTEHLPTGRRAMPLCLRAVACQLLIRCAVSLLPRSADGDLGFLVIDAAKADIAVGPCWASRDRPTIDLRVCGAGRACDQCYEPCKCSAHELAASKSGHSEPPNRPGLQKIKPSGRIPRVQFEPIGIQYQLAPMLTDTMTSETMPPHACG